MSGPSEEPREPVDRPEVASTIVRRCYIPLPSWYDPDRYQPERPGSSRLAWLLGALGLVLPPLSLVGAFSGWRASRRGNRAGTAAMAWCALTAVTSLALWVPLFIEAGSSPPATFALELEDVRTGAQPPTGLGFAASEPTSSYAEIDLAMRNRSSQQLALSPTSIDVYDRSGNRLAWATDDAAFLAQRDLGGNGFSTYGSGWRCPPAGPSGRSTWTTPVWSSGSETASVPAWPAGLGDGLRHVSGEGRAIDRGRWETFADHVSVLVRALPSCDDVPRIIRLADVRDLLGGDEETAPG